jgi:hypothetical protein
MKNITHVEYGIYLVAVGTEMRKRNLCLTDVIDPVDPIIREKAVASMVAQGMSSARAPEVFDSAYVAMRTLNFKTYQSRNAATKADDEANKPEEDEF